MQFSEARTAELQLVILIHPHTHPHQLPNMQLLITASLNQVGSLSSASEASIRWLLSSVIVNVSVYLEDFNVFVRHISSHDTYYSAHKLTSFRQINQIYLSIYHCEYVWNYSHSQLLCLFNADILHFYYS